MKNEPILPFIQKPGRYIGNEFNVITTEPEPDALSCALVFPDLYEIGMSHQGLLILYHILNGQDKIVAERCYCPDIDAEALLKKENYPLITMESGRPLSSFDFIGITLPHELCYTNILTILDRAQIPFYAADRTDTHPVILGGGTCAFNPEPVAEFFDAILLGDGEEAIVEISEFLIKAKENNLGKQKIIKLLAKIEGVYIPGLYQPKYLENGALKEIEPITGSPATVKRRILKDLDDFEHLKRPLVPNTAIVHDRLGIEIARGCTRGCRFCQAGMTYRPVRERTVSQIIEIAESGIACSGFEELALLSLSTGDYSCLSELLPRLMDRFVQDYVSISLPSMRVGTLTPELMDEIKRVRKTGFTLAPEAGSERLRKAINKGISETDLLNTTENAFQLGWSLMKLYFMIGLPTETLEDIDAITDLTKKVAAAGKISGTGRKKVNVSIGTFVPKPHTPFQWERQLSIHESTERIERLKQTMPRGVKLKWHDPKQSYLEGVFARGDRRLAPLIIDAWRNGARMDSWSDHFDLKRWQQSAKKLKIDLDFYLRARSLHEILPWQHLSSRVEPRFLEAEREHALTGTYTPDCRYHGCRQCGLCDFKTIKPIVHNPGKLPPSPRPAGRKTQQPETHNKYQVNYSRRGLICFLGHLDFLQVIFRALRRADIKTNFSHGFNPSPKISFGPALPVGTESLCEYFIMDVPEPLKNINRSIAALNSALPAGIAVNSITSSQGALPQEIVATYQICLDLMLNSRHRQAIDRFLESDNHFISRSRKGKTKNIDIRPLILQCTIVSEDRLIMKIISKSGEPGIKPLEAAACVLAEDHQGLLKSRVCKTDWQPFSKQGS